MSSSFTDKLNNNRKFTEFYNVNKSCLEFGEIINENDGYYQIKTMNSQNNQAFTVNWENIYKLGSFIYFVEVFERKRQIYVVARIHKHTGSGVEVKLLLSDINKKSEMPSVWYPYSQVFNIGTNIEYFEVYDNITHSFKRCMIFSNFVDRNDRIKVQLFEHNTMYSLTENDSPRQLYVEASKYYQIGTKIPMFKAGQMVSSSSSSYCHINIAFNCLAYMVITQHGTKQYALYDQLNIIQQPKQLQQPKQYNCNVIEKSKYDELFEKYIGLQIENYKLNEKIKNILNNDSKNDKYDNNDIDIDECKLKFREWLEHTVHLKQYLQLFVDNEYDDINMVMFFDCDTLKEIGINKMLHLKLIMKRIDEFKELMNEFSEMLEIYKELKMYKIQFTKYGILTIGQLRNDIKTTNDVTNILGINDDIKINYILKLIHANDEGQCTQ